MEQAYKKECRLTLLAFAVVTLMTHIFPLYFLFPELTQMVWLGFPAHYLLTIIVGWLFLIPLYWLYINASEKIDREIEETSWEAADQAEADAARKMGGAGARAR